MTALFFTVTPWADPEVKRTIEIASSSSLADLHAAIIEAFDYDSDHLHAFFMNGHAWDQEFGIWATPDPGQRGTRKTKLESLNLREKKRFLYLYDYGDEHRFDVRLTRTDPTLAGTPAGQVVEAVGEAPPQYESDEWDEEDEEYDESDGEEGSTEDESTGDAAPSPEMVDLIRRLEPVVLDWVERKGDFEEDDEFEGDSDEDDEFEGEEDEGQTPGEEAAALESGATPSGDATTTLAKEAALAVELLDLTRDDIDALLAIDKEFGGTLVSWLVALPERLVDDDDRVEQGLTLAERLQRVEDTPKIRAALPVYLARAGRRDEARAQIERLVADEPEDAFMLFHAGRGWSALGESERAERCYREALSFAGSEVGLRADILERLAELLRSTGGDVESLLRTERNRADSLRRALAQGTSGPQLPVKRTEPKVGRNDPCPCKSGKKFKKCCGGVNAS